MTTLHPESTHPKYRADIDGLRAIAVLAVVAFHAFPTRMKGGFIGVDIFFVISGFLITTIIFLNLEKNRFSFSDFYIRRIKRIFPALLVVLGLSYAFGWFILFPDEYQQLGKHIAAGAGFIANLVLWKESGYFDNSVETKPLLHLWSLGIEEQFYIVWPLVLWCAWKLRFNLFVITIFSLLISFFLNAKGINKDAVATFYSPKTRFWELLCGSALAWIVLYKNIFFVNVNLKINNFLYKKTNKESLGIDENIFKNIISLVGFFALIYGFCRINQSLSFPGYWAAIPVFGTVLLILAGPNAWINKKILSNKILVWFGLISFPLYLWHWPLLSFARILDGETPSLNVRISAAVLSVVLAWITYKFIERPIRINTKKNSIVLFLVMAMFAVGVTGYTTYSQDGLPSRGLDKKFTTYRESIKTPDRSKECFEIPYAYKKSDNWFCDLGDKNSPVEYFAYGDSHALSLLPALERFATDNKVRIQFTGASGCPSVLGVQSMRGDSGIETYNCRELNKRVFDYVKDTGIKSVILANRWTYYTDSFSRPSEFNPISRNPNLPVDKITSTKDLFWAIENTFLQYSSVGVNVFFVEDNPQQIYEPKDILRKGRANESEYLKFSVSLDEHNKNQRPVNEILRKTGADIINLDDVLCSGEICPLVAGSKFLYSDDDHLSVDGSLFISQSLSNQLKKNK
jgi:peptidoglycan/LPS O-acetylase OafA/YrhL